MSHKPESDVWLAVMNTYAAKLPETLALITYRERFVISCGALSETRKQQWYNLSQRKFLRKHLERSFTRVFDSYRIQKKAYENKGDSPVSETDSYNVGASYVAEAVVLYELIGARRASKLIRKLEEAPAVS